MNFVKTINFDWVVGIIVPQMRRFKNISEELVISFYVKLGRVTTFMKSLSYSVFKSSTKKFNLKLNKTSCIKFAATCRAYEK